MTMWQQQRYSRGFGAILERNGTDFKSRTPELVASELRDWSALEATNDEDYQFAVYMVKCLTAELHWRSAGYEVKQMGGWGGNGEPCIQVYTYLEDEARKASTIGDGLECIHGYRGSFKDKGEPAGLIGIVTLYVSLR
jgi:hypothetical protein